MPHVQRSATFLQSKRDSQRTILEGRYIHTENDHVVRGKWFQERPLDFPNKINFPTISEYITYILYTYVCIYAQIMYITMPLKRIEIKPSETMYHWVHFCRHTPNRLSSARRSPLKKNCTCAEKILGNGPDNWEKKTISRWNHHLLHPKWPFWSRKTAQFGWKIPATWPGGSDAWAAAATDLWRLWHLPTPAAARPTWKRGK